MWQKERLLNIGIRALPSSCDAVAVLDSDIVFENGDWPAEAERLLGDRPVIQPYSRVRHLGRDRLPETSEPADVIVSQTSAAAAIAAGQAPDAVLGPQTGNGRGAASPGHAWVFRREILEKNGLFEGSIIGGGDTAVACASFGVLDAVERRHEMNGRQRAFYRAWAEPWASEATGRVGVLRGDILHLWHGDLVMRQAAIRHQRLAPFSFDPAVDITASSGEAWRWASAKPEMHRHVKQYFADRRDDG
jgi:hypothetical protein